MPRGSRRSNATDDIILPNQTFRFIASRPLDNKYRISLGRKIIDLLRRLSSFQSLDIYMSNEGYILLRPMEHIPANEMWTWENPEIRESFMRALEDVHKGETTKVEDLDKFLESL